MFFIDAKTQNKTVWIALRRRRRKEHIARYAAGRKQANRLWLMDELEKRVGPEARKLFHSSSSRSGDR
jgi:hypothetical protein